MALSDVGSNFDISALHINQALTTMSVGYENAEFVAEQVAPIVPTDKLSDEYWQFGFEKFNVVNDAYQPGTSLGEIGWSATASTFNCKGHGVRGWYPSVAPSAADAVIDLDVETTEDASQAVLLVQEINLLNALLGSGMQVTDVSTSPNVGNLQYSQFDNNDFDPVTFLDNLKEVIARSIGKKPNSLLLGREAFRGLRNNINVTKRVSTGTVALEVAPNKIPSIGNLSELLEIPNIIVAEAMYNTALPGATPSLSYIWSNYAMLFYKEPQPGRRKVSLAYTFRWNAGSAGQFVQKWYDQDKKRQCIDVQKFYAQQMIATGAGIMLKNTTQS